jgi:hypothetical protein
MGHTLMKFLLPLLALLLLPLPAAAQNFGNIKPNTILGNPDPTATKPAVPMDRSTFDVRQWGAKDDGGATDSSAAINAAIAYVAGVGGTIDLGGGTYGVCANPILLTTTNTKILLNNGKLVLQTGCATPPPEILHNTVSTLRYDVGANLANLVVDGGCATKYVYRIDGGDRSTHLNVTILNPAPNATIAGSAGVYINGGSELKFGATNWVSATGTCYNTGLLPAYGIQHAVGGNADFGGVIVLNFTTGILAGGDDFFGPGTHVWGGLKVTGSTFVFDPALRTNIGIDMAQSSGGAYGVEVDDPITAGIFLRHSSTLDRMVVIGTDCVYVQTPVAGQTCVTVGAGTAGSLVSGTTAPQIGAAGFPQNIVTTAGGAIDPSTTIANNPGASVYSGDAATIAMFAQLPVSPAGCVGQNGYLAGAAACAGRGWQTGPYGGCQVKSMSVNLGAAPGAGATTTFTVQDNGVDTALTGTLSGTGGFSLIQANTVVNIPPNHSITLRVNTTAGAPATAEMRASLYGCG